MERLIEIEKVKPVALDAKKCDKFGIGLEGDARLVDLMSGKVHEFSSELMEDIGCGVKWFQHIPTKDNPLMITFGDFFEVQN